MELNAIFKQGNQDLLLGIAKSEEKLEAIEWHKPD